VSKRATAHALIKALCSFVPGPNFQGDFEYARYDGAFLEPLEQLAPDTRSSIGRSHGEKVQVRDVVAIAHDRKPGYFLANACDQHVNIGGTNARCYPRRCPPPSEPVFN
jgi:hypothetical protein